MKKTAFVLSLILFLGFQSFAQLKSNVIFFTQQGERFFLIVNGIRQNTTAETNVKVTDMMATQFKVKIIFEDSNLGEIDKDIFINQGTETTVNVQRNNKGRWTVRLISEVPIAQAMPPAPGQRVIVFGTPQLPASTSISTGTTTQQTTITTGTNVVPNASVGVSVNDPALGVNMNLNINTGTTQGNVTTSTQTTTYQTTTQTTQGAVVTQTPPAPGQVYVMQGYSGPTGCPWPMSFADFQSVKQSISAKSFEDSKLTIAKQVLASNCLTCKQVKEIMLLFTFEETRLDFAKFAYGRTFDIGNYFKLNDAFTFESSIDELNQYISGYTW